jgi:parallel beta-helix repeat protein
MYTLVLVLLTLLAPTLTQAATLYVSPSGGGGCSTNRDNPSGSVSGSLGCLKPGDTLYFRKGSYNLGAWSMPISGTASARITLAGDPQDGKLQAVLNVGARGNNGVAIGPGKNYLDIVNLVFDGSEAEAAVIKFTGGRYNRIMDCDIRRGGTQGILLVSGSSNNEILRNKIHDNGHSSLDHGIYSSSPNNLYDGNEIWGHTGFAIHNYNEGDSSANAGNISRNNNIHDNGYGLLLSNGPNQQGYNNRIYNQSHWGIQVYGANGSLVANNTVVGNREQAMLISSSGQVRNNILWQNGSGITDESGGSAAFSHNLTGDPKFVNAGNGDFRLQQGSPAINAGTSTGVEGVVKTDADGHARPVEAYDIGAYEYGSSGGETVLIPPPLRLRLVGGAP